MLQLAPSEEPNLVQPKSNLSIDGLFLQRRVNPRERKVPLVGSEDPGTEVVV